ncbi:MAG: peptide chain release factor N(5)-glutamine methyltransferase [Gammaproteobacteria bacterium]|nr:peptide chain release factor N(5)-glutamine methyltransferase [Gammaproteobacteria bacterium]
MNIKQICSQVSATIERLEVEILLSHVLNKPRVYLYSHPEEPLTSEQCDQFNQLIKRREQGEPLVYITGKTEFYGLAFDITPDVLVPRPETELLIDYILDNLKVKTASVLELGTGSGIIAITLAKYRPDWNITATDISAGALTIAKRNSHFHDAKTIRWIESDWYSNIKVEKYDLIISNPPYIAKDDPHLRDLSYEPHGALISGHEGLDAIKKIIKGATGYLVQEGEIVLEHGYNQAEAVQNCLHEHGFKDIKTLDDLNHQPRVTIATHP